MILVVLAQHDQDDFGANARRIEAAFGSDTTGYWSDPQGPGGWRIRYPRRDATIRVAVARSIARLERRGLLQKAPEARGYWRLNEVAGPRSSARRSTHRVRTPPWWPTR